MSSRAVHRKTLSHIKKRKEKKLAEYSRFWVATGGQIQKPGAEYWAH
jgi:uncharacterized protein VirK/YbjX